ncbi:unnamed protein product [marine sediment metagenome]|uniref:Uncharacterized protein n=1 Tax=marine sediment metagenome TaxID=412755 RepID=X1NHG5_9ZZZZ
MTSTLHVIGITIDVGTIKPDPKRMSFAIFNKHATATVYLKEGKEVSAANGIPIYPKGSLSVSYIDDGETVREEWSTISDTVVTSIVVFEGSK